MSEVLETLIDTVADALSDTCDMDVSWHQYAKAAIDAILHTLPHLGLRIVPVEAAEHDVINAMYYAITSYESQTSIGYSPDGIKSACMAFNDYLMSNASDVLEG